MGNPVGRDNYEIINTDIYTVVTLGGKPFIFTRYLIVGISCISPQIIAIHSKAKNLLDTFRRRRVSCQLVTDL